MTNMGMTFQKKQLNAMLGGTLPAATAQRNKLNYASSLNFTPKNTGLKSKLISTENQKAQLLAFTLKRNRSTNLIDEDGHQSQKMQLPPVIKNNIIKDAQVMSKGNPQSAVILKQG